jgi:dihydroorotate dehydrogenase
MLSVPFYDPQKSYEENFEQGPFGAFADGVNVKHSVFNTKPKYDFFGFKINSLFGIPAGPLVNGKFIQVALDAGFDIVIYKTVRSGKHPCHPWPNVLSVKIEGNLTLKKAQGKLVADNNYAEPLSITNSFGVPSFAPEFWQKDLANVVKNTRSGQIVVGSFQGTKKPARPTGAGGEGQNVGDYINDFILTARLLKETGVKVMEVNLSCPNEGTDNLLCYDIERSLKVVKAIKNEIKNIPLIVKISYFKDDAELKNFVEEVEFFVQGISAINTISAEIVDKNGTQALPGEGRSRSGVCGCAIKWAGLDMVRKLKKIREESGYLYKIIGVGGVMNADDFFEYRDAGADFVMSATGAMWNPYLAQEIKEKLR